MSRRPARDAGASAAVLVALELTVALLALVGGTLLAIRPDGSLLQADPQTLAGTPFDDWRWPGVLLAILVGGSFALAATVQVLAARAAELVSGAVGGGLIAFEAVEWAWLGAQPLEFVFAAVGLTVTVLALQVRVSVRGTAHGRHRR